MELEAITSETRLQPDMPPIFLETYGYHYPALRGTSRIRKDC